MGSEPVGLRLRKYKVVGWFSQDPHDERVSPFSISCEVEARFRDQASDLGYKELDRMRREMLPDSRAELLNWYTKEVL